MNKLIKASRKKVGLTLLAAAATVSSSAQAALDQTAIDAALAGGATDVAYLGGGFMVLLIGVVIWSYLRRTAK
jgi:hypothetical protein